MLVCPPVSDTGSGNLALYFAGDRSVFCSDDTVWLLVKGRSGNGVVVAHADVTKSP